MSSPAPDDSSAVVDFTLRLGERSMQARTRLPAGDVRMVELLPVLRKFQNAVIGAAVEETQDAGRKISCCAGCGACCRQIVPISEHEALFLLEWIDTLPENEQALIRSRFEAAVAALDAQGLLQGTRNVTSMKEKQERLRFSMDYFRAGVACPFLMDESCSIHPIRPMKCREYLVTSPAENCAQPTAESIEMVKLPATFSKILFHFDKEKAEGKSRWLPLVLLLEWGARHRQDPQRRADSVVLFREFLARLADVTPEALQQMLPSEVSAEPETRP